MDETPEKVGDQEEVVLDMLEHPAAAERLAELELALDSLGAALDAGNDRLKALEKLEARITHLEARTRDATINADIVSLQGKVTSLEGVVGAEHAPAIVAILSANREGMSADVLAHWGLLGDEAAPNG